MELSQEDDLSLTLLDFFFKPKSIVIRSMAWPSLSSNLLLELVDYVIEREKASLAREHEVGGRSSLVEFGDNFT